MVVGGRLEVVEVVVEVDVVVDVVVVVDVEVDVDVDVDVDVVEKFNFGVIVVDSSLGPAMISV